MVFLISLTATAHFVRSKACKGRRPRRLGIFSEFVLRAAESSCFSHNLIGPSVKSCGIHSTRGTKPVQNERIALFGCSGGR